MLTSTFLHAKDTPYDCCWQPSGRGDAPTVVEGDATSPSILAQADPVQTDILAALTEEGPTNFAVCAEMKHFSDEIHAIARIEYPDGRGAEEEFVDQVVSPERAGAKAAIN